MKTISILGSTGSIGKMTLEVIGNLKNYKVISLSINTNVTLLKKQIIKYKPREVAICDETIGKCFIKKEKEFLKKYKLNVHLGDKGLQSLAGKKVDVVFVAVVGAVGLLPILEAIKTKNNICLANKEPLVIAGDIINAEAKTNNVNIMPVDSEHSAIFQCLQGEDINKVNKIFITASGGPFYGKTKKYLESVTVSQATHHPRWQMGKKITVDSATLMNKGLEIIEACCLFGIKPDKIEVLIHPESIVHSMVEFVDGSIKAQLALPDMRHAIQYALTYPERKLSCAKKIDFTKIKNFTFNIPKLNDFPCLKLALDALHLGGSMPVVLNASNEVAVQKFLKGKISFLDIPKYISKVIKKHRKHKIRNVSDVLMWDKWARSML